MEPRSRSLALSLRQLDGAKTPIAAQGRADRAVTESLPSKLVLDSAEPLPTLT